MKRFMLLIAVFAISLIITACSDDNNANDNEASDDVSGNQEQNDNKQSGNNANDNAPADDNSNNGANDNNTNTESAGDMQSKMDKLDYTEIEVEVDYGDDNEYEVEIEQDEGEEIESEMEDEVNDVFLDGEEAFNELYPMVKELSIDHNTGKDDAIQDVLDIFDLDDDYKEFELEITFDDGSEIEYEEK